MEIGLDSNINTEASLFEEDSAATDLNEYNYVYSGVGSGVFVPAPLDVDGNAQIDTIGPVSETDSTTDNSSLDNGSSTNSDITGTIGSTGSSDLVSIDNNGVNSFEATSAVVEDWSGGYKLEIDITATSQTGDWTVDFDLPYQISESYGVELLDNEDGSYTIKPENGGDSGTTNTIESVFIVDDNGEEAIIPELTFSNTEEVAESETATNSSPSAEETEEPATEPGNSAEETEEPATEPGNSAEETEEPATEPGNSAEETEEEPEEKPVRPADGDEIFVDRDFGGDLDEAISSAKDGDIFRLSANTTYSTEGITFNNNIIIDGQEGTVIDGGGTSETIFSMYSGASGTVIQDIEITNGNNAIIVNGASDVTLNNLEIHNMGIEEVNRKGQNNSGISLDHADDFKVVNSEIYNIGRKGIGIYNTDGGTVRNVDIQNINLAAEHAQSFDAGGIKLFNTNEIVIEDNNLQDINGFMIWNDTTNATVIEGNVVLNAGEDFQAPDFNNNVYMTGIYNEKSSNAVVRGNTATSVENFFAFRATEYSTSTMTLGENNFSDFELNTTDYWVNEEAEKLIAETEDPDEATFDLISDDFFAQANIDEKEEEAENAENEAANEEAEN